MGILFRNAEAIELMRKVDTLVVDKTGTLTEGRPRLVSVVPAQGRGEDELLRLAASLERGSEHPLAAAIVRGAAERGVKLADATDFDSITGKGVRGRVDGRDVALGNRALLDELRHRCAPALRARGSAARGGPDGDVRRGGRRTRRPDRRCRSDQGDHARGDPRRCTARACAS